MDGPAIISGDFGSVEVISFTESVIAHHRQATVKTMEDIGSLIEVDIKERICEPWPPASLPYNYPHRRTGLLRAGIGHDTSEEPDAVVETIYSSRAGGDPMVPVYLEGGTDGPRIFEVRLGVRRSIDRGRGGMAPRPYMTPAMNDWAPRLSGEIAAGIVGNLEFSGV